MKQLNVVLQRSLSLLPPEYDNEDDKLQQYSSKCFYETFPKKFQMKVPHKNQK